MIYNPVAGRNPSRREREVRAAAEALKAAGINAKLARTLHPESATKLARAAVAAGDNLILVCGGDGTINEVLNGMCPGTAALAILPGGTANIIANELGLPHHPVRAAQELPAWKPRRIAVGYATGRAIPPAPPSESVQRYFLSVAGAGFDAYIVHRLGFGFKMALGVAAYVIEGLKQAVRYSFPSLACQIDSRTLRGTLVIVQRTSRYAGWFRTAPHQSITNSQFGVCLYTSTNRLRYAAYALSVLTGWRLRDVKRIETRRVTIAPAKPGPPVYFELDGELAGALPAAFEIAPDALTLLMP